MAEKRDGSHLPKVGLLSILRVKVNDKKQEASYLRNCTYIVMSKSTKQRK